MASQVGKLNVILVDLDDAKLKKSMDFMGNYMYNIVFSLFSIFWHVFFPFFFRQKIQIIYFILFFTKQQTWVVSWFGPALYLTCLV